MSPEATESATCLYVAENFFLQQYPISPQTLSSCCHTMPLLITCAFAGSTVPAPAQTRLRLASHDPSDTTQVVCFHRHVTRGCEIRVGLGSSCPRTGLSRELPCSTRPQSVLENSSLIWWWGTGPVHGQLWSISELPFLLCSGPFPQLQHSRALED